MVGGWVSGLTKGNGIVGVSQRWGKSIKLALSGLGCPSLPDMFHLLYALSKSIGSAIARQQVQLQKQHQGLQEKLKTLSSPAAICQPKSQYYKPNRTNWKSTVKTISKIYALSQTIHFWPQHRESQFGFELPTRLQSILANVERLGQTYAPTRAAAAIDVWQRQIPHLSGTIHAWWQWVLQALCSQTQDRIHIGCSQFSCLGSIGINKPKGTPNSNRATNHSTSALVFWHIVSLTPRH